ncbi:cation channel sperm-associated protein 1 [Thomomys bottae]
MNFPSFHSEPPSPPPSAPSHSRPRPAGDITGPRVPGRARRPARRGERRRLVPRPRAAMDERPRLPETPRQLLASLFARPSPAPSPPGEAAAPAGSQPPGGFLEVQEPAAQRPPAARSRGVSLSPPHTPALPLLGADAQGAEPRRLSRVPAPGILHHPETAPEAAGPAHHGRHHHGHGGPHHPGEPGGAHGRHGHGGPHHRPGPHHLRADSQVPEEPAAQPGEELHPRGPRGSQAVFPHKRLPSVVPSAVPSVFPSAVPSAMRVKDSVQSAGQPRGVLHSRTSRASSKIHPQFTTKESEIWTEEEKLHRRKTGKMLRGHRKLYGGNVFFRLLEKVNVLIWGLRSMMWTLTQSMAFETVIFLFVCLNTFTLVAQTFAELEIRGEWYFMVLDCIFLCVYVIEAVLKIIALGLTYFYDPWNNLDFFIMIMAVLEFASTQISSLTYTFYNHGIFRILKVFKSLRALRALRVLRRLSILTSLHEVTGTLARTLPSITAILILMFTCLFLFSVVLRALFRQTDPRRFQSILTTIFTLFTLLTLDDWSLIYLDSRAQGAWYIIPILMIYIIIQYFIFLNLVIAVLVDNFQMALLRNLEKVKQEKAARIHEKLLDDSLNELTQAEPEEASANKFGKEFIERKFGAMTEKQKKLQFLFLQLVAAVEQQQQKFRSQASVMDEIVDKAFEAGEEDFKD